MFSMITMTFHNHFSLIDVIKRTSVNVTIQRQYINIYNSKQGRALFKPQCIVLARFYTAI